MEKKICNVCAEDKNDAEFTKCIKCDYECCKTCLKTYIKSNFKDIVNCMNCKITFTRHTLVSMLGITYITKDFQKIQNKIRIDRQISKLSTFQEKAKTELLIEKESKELEDLCKIINEKKKIIRNLYDITKFPVTKKNYIRPCSVKDCRGFLSANYKCELCNITTCSDCLEPKLDDHVCNEDLKATATLIKKDTKNCPKCGMGIYKIDGCDQIWCSLCQTAFSWKTGIIETGRIHNPHYYEFLRKQNNGEIPREEELVARVNCQNRQLDNVILRNCNSIYKNNKNDNIKKIMLYITDYIRYYYHNLSIKESFGINLLSFDNKLERLNVDYLKGTILKESYEKSVSLYEKKKELLMEKNMIMITLTEGINDMMLDFYDKSVGRTNKILLSTNEQIAESLELMNTVNVRLYNLIEYCKDEDVKLSKLYSSKTRLDIDNIPKINN